MTGSPRDGREGFVITRERLLDGAHLAGLRARATPDFPIRSDAELEASLDAALRGHEPGHDVWVFGYGSLVVERARAGMTDRRERPQQRVEIVHVLPDRAGVGDRGP